MKISVPEYFTKFKCRADKCRDNCCIGWEIDVDECTLARYKALDGEEGNRIRSTLNMGDPVTFKLLERERCANLDSSGLCKIISNLGEDYLCQICRDHPRYFNWVVDSYEGGIGIACEEAAELVLTAENITKAVAVEYPEITPRYVCDESLAQDAREIILTYLDDMEMQGESARVAINRLLNFAAQLDSAIVENMFSNKKVSLGLSDLQSSNCNKDCSEEIVSIICSAFDESEALTADFHLKLKSAKEAISTSDFFRFLDEGAKKYFTNLLCYFIHRYFLCDEADYVQSMSFAVASALLILAIFYVGGDYTVESIVAEAKNFSKNVEYSEENVEKAMENMGKILRFF